MAVRCQPPLCSWHQGKWGITYLSTIAQLDKFSVYLFQLKTVCFRLFCWTWSTLPVCNTTCPLTTNVVSALNKWVTHEGDFNRALVVVLNSMAGRGQELNVAIACSDMAGCCWPVVLGWPIASSQGLLESTAHVTFCGMLHSLHYTAESLLCCSLVHPSTMCTAGISLLRCPPVYVKVNNARHRWFGA